MLNFDEKQEAKLEQEAFEITMAERARKEREGQIVAVTATEFAKTAQYRALLLTLRSAMAGERYDLEKVAAHVVSTFNELEGAGC